MMEELRREIPVCVCPEHGWVYGDNIDNCNPNAARCAVDGCGTELEIEMAEKEGDL